jgi:putative endonuclease
MPSTECVPQQTETATRVWFVYMILTERDTLYTGITTHVERRFKQHLDVFNGVAKSKGAKYFRGFKPISVCFQQAFGDRSSASKYECELKRMSRGEKLERIAQAQIEVG